MNNRLDAPGVSLGLPLYNGEAYLEETVRSLLDQTYSDFELIIADNASTDRSAEICRDLASTDARIRFLPGAENVGASRNYNRAFHEARAPYFKWVAHDDPCAPRFLEVCVAVLDRHADTVLSYPRTVLINREGQLKPYWRQYVDGCHLIDERPHRRLRRFFDIGNQCHPVFGLIRSDVLRRTGLIRSCLSADRILLGELALHGKLREIDEPLAFRRVHPKVSTVANRDDRALLAWFDPRAKHRAPWLQIKLEYARMIACAPLSGVDRLRCYAELLLFLAGLHRSPNGGVRASARPVEAR